MKKFVVIFILNCFGLICYGQFHERIYFNKLFNQNYASGCESIIEHDSSYYACGMCLDSLSYLKTIVILKLDFEGNLTFWKEFRRNNTDHYAGQPSSFHYVGNNNFVDGGTAGLQGHLRKINEEGDTIWTRLYLSELGNQMIMDYCRQLPDKGFICTGQDDYVDAYPDIVLLRTDSIGNELWRAFYGWNTADKGFKVLPTYNGSYIISGYTYLPEDMYSGDALLIKTNSLGVMLWCRTPGNPEYRDGYGSVTIAPDGNYVFGYTHAVYQGPPYPVPESYCKIKFIKFDQNGDTIWERMYGNAFQINMLRNIITLHDGSFMAVGYANSDTVNGVFQGWLFKINQYGDSVWYRDYRHYSSSSLDYLYDIYETSDHGLIACGESSYAEPGPDAIQRMWILKLDSAGCEEAGCDSTVGITEELGGMEAGRHGEFIIWPNPAKEQIHIRWLVNEFKCYHDFGLEIYNIFGRKATTLTFPSIASSGMAWTLDISSYPPGIYVAIIRENHIIRQSVNFVVMR
jgi:hypothetical protein